LLADVLEAEARRRYLESLSMYERQGLREGPEAPVDSVAGLGLVLTVPWVGLATWHAYRELIAPVDDRTDLRSPAG
jgi:hypothetical protein